MFYNVNLKHNHFLADKDYQDFVLFNLFRYTDTVDVSSMSFPYCTIEAWFDSRQIAERFVRENDFVQSIRGECDRAMMREREFVQKVQADESKCVDHLKCHSEGVVLAVPRSSAWSV